MEFETGDLILNPRPDFLLVDDFGSFALAFSRRLERGESKRGIQVCKPGKTNQRYLGGLLLFIKLTYK